METLMEYKGVIFWFFFVLLGAFVIGGIFANLFFIDILLGLILIIFGIQRLDEEYNKRKTEREFRGIKEIAEQASRHAEESRRLMEQTKYLQENKLFKLDRRKADTDKKIEDNYRDLTRKILEIENRLNEVTISYARGERIRSGRR